MTETAVESESVGQAADRPSSAVSDEQLIAMLVDRARSEGLQLTEGGGESEGTVRLAARHATRLLRAAGADHRRGHPLTSRFRARCG
jgi:hypothetical protein